MSRSKRRSAPRLPVPLLALALVLLGAVLGLAAVPMVPAPSQEATSEGRRAADNYDYFVTDPKETVLDLSGELALPPDFFDKGSTRFEGRIAFKGVPVGKFDGRKTGNADTIVARTSMPKLGSQYPSCGSTEVKVVALSLASVEPVKVNVAGRTELWDVKLQLSSKKPSAGRMAIVQKDATGGTFDSRFTVYPLLTFVRQGDKAKRTLDVGGLKLSQTQSVTLAASSVPWSTKPPQARVVQTGTFFPGVELNRVVVIRHEIRHAVQLAVPELDIPVPGPR